MQNPTILPKPVSLIAKPGIFHLTKTTPVVANAEAQPAGELFMDLIAPATGFTLSILEIPTSSPSINFAIRPGLSLPTEGYQLTISPQQIDVLASQPAGLRNAVQTLRQLLPAQIYSPDPVKGVDWILPVSNW